jgi:hypothetical protein
MKITNPVNSINVPNIISMSLEFMKLKSPSPTVEKVVKAK